MSRKWSWFLGASILAGYLLIAAGGPPVAILFGIALGALITARRSPAA